MLKKNILSTFLFIGLAIFSAAPAYGQGDILPAASGGTAGCPSGDATYCGNYALSDFMVLAINISRVILGLVGSLSLIMFVYGGVTFMVSAGSADKVGQAKKIIIAAVIGLGIVFASYLIIKFTLGSLGLNWNGGAI